MKKRTIIILTVSTIALLGGILLYSLLSNQDTTIETKKNNSTIYTSMEDGSTVTEDDIKSRQDTEDFAQTKSLEYFRREHSDAINIIVSGVEWYFSDTDDTSYDSLLATASITNLDGSITNDMIVLDISKEKPRKVARTYEPDERYSIYE